MFFFFFINENGSSKKVLVVVPHDNFFSPINHHHYSNMYKEVCCWLYFSEKKKLLNKMKNCTAPLLEIKVLIYKNFIYRAYFWIEKKNMFSNLMYSNQYWHLFCIKAAFFLFSVSFLTHCFKRKIAKANIFFGFRTKCRVGALIWHMCKL